MQEIIKKYEKKIQDKNAKRRKLKIVTAIASLAVVCIVLWALILPGVAMSGQPKCGKEEHRHSDACYTEKLTCGQKETDGHTHTDACYKTEKKLICGQEESETHQHTDACYQEEKTLICGKQEEAAHHHTAACYTRELTCGKEEHTHTDECYSDPTADVENEDSWTTTFRHAELGDDWGKNVAAIAETQIGYRESSNNYSVSENREHKGYTRYTAWYGDYYKDWDTAFAAFCIHYAGVPDDAFPTDIKADEWIKKLQEKDWYADKTSEDYQVGDLIFLHKKNQETDIQVGVISKIFEKDGKTYIQTIEGNCDNQVKKNEYAADDENISGYGLLCKAQMKYKADQMAQENAKSEAKAEETASNTADSTKDDTAQVQKSNAQKKRKVFYSSRSVNEDNASGNTATVSEEGQTQNANTSATTGFDLQNATTLNTNVYKIENGVWKKVDSSSTFNKNDSIKVNVSYTLPHGAVGKDNDTVYYQLPDGITIENEESGDVINDGKVIGKYTIDKKGKATIVFNESFISSGTDFKGTIAFEGKISKDTSKSDETIKFPGTGTEIIIKQETVGKDLWVSKNAQLDNTDKTKVHYTVTAGSNQGSNGKVTISDAFAKGTAKGTYDKTSFKLQKVKSNGSTENIESSTYSVDFGTITSEGEKNDTFTIKDLPELAAGEKYVLTYDASTTNKTTTDGSTALNNNAGVESENDGKWTWTTNKTDISKSMISKYGSYDQSTGLITWKIKVNENGHDLDGFVLKDILPDRCEIVGNVKLQEIAGQWPTTEITPTDKTKFEYKFEAKYTDPNGKKHLIEDTDQYNKDAKWNMNSPYEFTITTTAPNKNTTVTNNATFGKNDEYKGQGNTDVKLRDENLNKSYTTTEIENGKVKYKWKSDITLPSGKIKDAFTYTDTILDGYNQEQVTLSDSHYAIAKDLQEELEKNLKLNVKTSQTELKEVGYNNDYATITVEYYNGKNKVDALDDKTHITSFKVIVTPKGDGFEGTYLKMEYSTIVDYSKMNEKDTVTFKNKGNVFDITKEAEHSHSKKPPLVKQSGKVENNWINYSGNTVNYDSNNHILYYRILVNTEYGYDEDITLKDTLPDKTSYIDGSLSAKFYKNDSELPDSNKWDGYKVNDNVSVTFENGKLEILIKKGYNSDYLIAGEGNTIAVMYQVKIDDDSWDNVLHESSGYVNTVTWGDKTVSEETTVTRPVSTLAKVGTVIEDETAGNVKEVEYSVIINPKGADLIQGKDTLKLIDTLTASQAENAALELSSIKMYRYDKNTENHRGGEIDKSNYTMSYDDKNKQMTFEIPDELPCVLVYRYKVTSDGVNKEMNLTNNVWLESGISTQNNQKVSVQNSSATAKKTELVMYKVDQDNYSKWLEGAKFEISEVKNDASTERKKTLETDADGKIDLATNNLATIDTLYEVKETQAPAGYAMETNNTYYYVVLDENNTLDNYWKSLSDAVKQKLGNDKNKIKSFKAYTSSSFFVTNKNVSISVRKVWENADGTVANNPGADSVQVQLYRSVELPDVHKITVNISNLHGVSSSPNIIENVPDGANISVPVSGVNPQLDGVYSNITLMNKSLTINNVTSDITFNIIDSQSWSTQVETWNVKSDKKVSYVMSTPEAVGNPVTLNASNQWKYVWTDNLQEKDEQGRTYYYSVQEISSVPNYDVSYTNNENIVLSNKMKEVTVTNKKNSSYELPSTGGVGTTGYLAGGAALMCLAALLYGYQLRRKRERGTM